jgi:hypothetical protein
MASKDNLQMAKDLVSAVALLVDHLEWLKERKNSEAVAKFSPIVQRFKDLVRVIAEENLLAGKASEGELMKLKQLADSMSNKIKHLESVLDVEMRLARGEMIQPKGRA